MLSGSVARGTLAYAATLITRRVQRDLFTSLVHKDIAFYDKTKTGQLLKLIHK